MMVFAEYLLVALLTDYFLLNTIKICLTEHVFLVNTKLI